MNGNRIETKVAVSVAEMARMVSLSRARFYQLVGSGKFPPPLYDVRTRRPIYPEELQRTIIEAKRRNCGVDGRPVLFYARGSRPLTPKPSRPIKAKPSVRKHADLLDGLADLGMTSTTPDQVEAAIKAVFPAGTGGVDGGALLRAVFLHLKRQNPPGSVAR